LAPVRRDHADVLANNLYVKIIFMSLHILRIFLL
jgi:hypothetical protein